MESPGPGELSNHRSNFGGRGGDPSSSLPAGHHFALISIKLTKFPETRETFISNRAIIATAFLSLRNIAGRNLYLRHRLDPVTLDAPSELPGRAHSRRSHR